jgi:hypothetical protein
MGGGTTDGVRVPNQNAYFKGEIYSVFSTLLL